MKEMMVTEEDKRKQKIKSTRKTRKKRNNQKRIKGKGSGDDDDSLSTSIIRPKVSDETGSNEDDRDINEEDIVCCLCNVVIDYSDRDTFHSPQLCDVQCKIATVPLPNSTPSIESSEENDNAEDSSNKESSTLSLSLYDSHNAILICDTPGCNRSYHQRCHFVPVLNIPRGSWNCLICQYREQVENSQQVSNKSTNKKKRRKKARLTSTETDITASDHMMNGSLNKASATVIHGDTYIVDSLSRILSAKEFDNLYKIPSQREENNDKAKLAMPIPTDSQMVERVKAEERFEFQSSYLKASLLHKELNQRIKGTIDSCLSRVRQSENTIRAYTETSRAKKSLIDYYQNSGKVPQELAQSLLRISEGKLRLRSTMMSLQRLVKNMNERLIIEQLQSNATIKKRSGETEMYSKLILSEKCRQEPRFNMDDYDGSEDDDHSTPGNEAEDDDPTCKIKCCMCFSGHTSEGNDVIMCDGEHCFRAFHMKCVDPPITQKMLDEDENGTWFCPFCTSFATNLHYIQREYRGDDDVVDEFDTEDQFSIKSWDEAGDVFPEAHHEIDTAKHCKSGKRSEKTDDFITSLVGKSMKDLAINEENDSESDVNFSGDENASASTSDEVSSVEWNINKNEIGALSDCSSEDDRSYSRRKSRRRVCKTEPSIIDEKNIPPESGELDDANIVKGKRNRTKVDYARLNQSLFGPENGSNVTAEDEDYEETHKEEKQSDYSSCESSSNESDRENSSTGNSDSDHNTKTQEQTDSEVKNSETTHEHKKNTKILTPSKMSTSEDSDLCSNSSARETDEEADTNKTIKMRRSPRIRKRRDG